MRACDPLNNPIWEILLTKFLEQCLVHGKIYRALAAPPPPPPTTNAKHYHRCWMKTRQSPFFNKEFRTHQRAHNKEQCSISVVQIIIVR